jgi:hypothetical protein
VLLYPSRRDEVRGSILGLRKSSRAGVAAADFIELSPDGNVVGIDFIRASGCLRYVAFMIETVTSGDKEEVYG